MYSCCAQARDEIIQEIVQEATEQKKRERRREKARAQIAAALAQNGVALSPTAREYAMRAVTAKSPRQLQQAQAQAQAQAQMQMQMQMQPQFMGGTFEPTSASVSICLGLSLCATEGKEGVWPCKKPQQAQQCCNTPTAHLQHTPLWLNLCSERRLEFKVVLESDLRSRHPSRHHLPSSPLPPPRPFVLGAGAMPMPMSMPMHMAGPPGWGCSGLSMPMRVAGGGVQQFPMMVMGGGPGGAAAAAAAMPPVLEPLRRSQSPRRMAAAAAGSASAHMNPDGESVRPARVHPHLVESLYALLGGVGRHRQSKRLPGVVLFWAVAVAEVGATPFAHHDHVLSLVSVGVPKYRAPPSARLHLPRVCQTFPIPLSFYLFFSDR